MSRADDPLQPCPKKMDSSLSQFLPDADATRSVAMGIADTLRGGEVIALVGQLGAGKTEFVKGLAAGLGYEGAVTSPTFSLVHEYAGGRLMLLHFDLYRLESEMALLALGWDEYLEENEAVTVVEWADRFPRMLPAHSRWFRLEHLESGGRYLRSIPAATMD